MLSTSNVFPRLDPFTLLQVWPDKASHSNSYRYVRKVAVTAERHRSLLSSRVVPMLPSVLQVRRLHPTCPELSVDGGTAYSVRLSLSNNNQ